MKISGLIRKLWVIKCETWKAAIFLLAEVKNIEENKYLKGKAMLMHAASLMKVLTSLINMVQVLSKSDEH